MTTSPEVAPALWTLRPGADEAVTLLQRELGIGSVLAKVLASRGWTDPIVARQFLQPDLDDLGDPRLLPDYAAASNILLGAIERKERIFVHGDYDVDGVTSTALLTRFLRALHADVVPHVPHRMREGYGINMSAIEAAKEVGAKVFLTCDCGTGAFEQIEAAREAGMKVVVTDHHELHGEHPQAHAFVNLHRTDHAYPFDGLCGVGLVFRLCEGLVRELGHPVAGYRRAFLDLAALGTVVDVMELLGENRAIVRHGLPEISRSKKPGIRALLETAECAGVDRLTTFHLGWRLGPRLNATGRVDDSVRALNLLLAEDEGEAKRIAIELEELNRERRATEARILQEAIEAIEASDWRNKSVLMIFGEGWHKGVVGVVAGRIVERYGRPALVGNVDREKGSVSGSARSIAAFHLKEAIDAMRPEMSGGGHAMAAGFSVPTDLAESVRAKLEAYAGERLTEDDFVRQVTIDAEAEVVEFTESAVRELEGMEPCGMGNPNPRLLVRGVAISGVKPMGDGTHASFLIHQGEQKCKGKLFSKAAEFRFPSESEKVDLVVRPKLNTWQGRTSVELEMEDLRASSE